MKCERVEEKLSAYIDNQLSPEEKRLVDEHLRSCTVCSGLLDELLKTVRQTQGLDQVDSPPWLRDKVMSKVGEAAGGRRGFFRRLFYPLHTKVPLEVVVTIAVVITAVYVFREMPTGVGPSIEGQKEVIPIEDEMKERSMKKAVPARRPSDKPARGGLSMKEQTEKAAPSPVESEKVSTYSDAVKDIDRQEPKTLANALAEMGKREEPALLYTILAEESHTVMKRLEGSLKLLHGKVIRYELYGEKQALVMELASDRVDEFYEILRDLGEVKAQRAGDESQRGVISIRVEVLTLDRISGDNL
jgi:hypothetical protein